MSESTRLLIKLMRPRLIVGLVAIFILFLCIGNVAWPCGPIMHALVIYMGAVSALLMRLHTLFNSTMFPVTNRQAAWLPMLAWALLCLAASFGILSGQMLTLIFKGSILEVIQFWRSAIWVWPSIGFLFLMAWRVIRYNPQSWWFILYFPILPSINNSLQELLLRVADQLIILSPLFAVGCIFYVLEAPHQTAMLCRLGYHDEGYSSYFKSRKVCDAPARPSWMTCIADGFIGMFGVSLGMLWFLDAMVLEDFTLGQIVQRENRWLIMTLFGFVCALLIHSILRHLWKNNRASGMTRPRAFKTLLLELTIFGYTFRDRLGVAHGEIVKCEYCQNWRMPWQFQCPHCGDTGIVALNAKTKSAERPKLSSWNYLQQNDPLALAFRYVLPAFLLFLIVFRLMVIFAR